jgi:AraC-like DNA-binding protein
VAAIWQRITERSFGRHIHPCAYAALLLEGSYQEAGDTGRFDVAPGCVVLHEAFEAHSDQFGDRGACIINLPIPFESSIQGGLGRVADPDLIVRLAEKSQQRAADALFSAIVLCRQEPDGIAAVLAADLIENPSLCLRDWAEMRGVRPWTISRKFIRAFGITAAEFRARSRTRLAWRAIRRTDTPLSAISQAYGFADQPHMTRCVTALTGTPPRAWRNRTRKSF